MSLPIDQTPDQWVTGAQRVPGSPEPGIYVMFRPIMPGRLEGDGIVIWHWHTATGTPGRWQAAGCGLHQVVSKAGEPLHLEPSLACENGCPNHGWIRGGRWTSA
jgi:hypothetical protein